MLWLDPGRVILPGDTIPESEVTLDVGAARVEVEQLITRFGTTTPERDTVDAPGGKLRLRASPTRYWCGDWARPEVRRWELPCTCRRSFWFTIEPVDHIREVSVPHSRAAFALIIGALLPTLLAAQTPMSDKRLVNTDRSGLGLQGYDPVGFFTMQQAVPGKPEYSVTFRGATYRFASAEHKAMFEAGPARYEPAFGGYCAYGVSQGGLFEVDIRTAQILDGRLVLNKTLRVKEMFDRDRENRLRLADQEWPKLVDRHGKSN